MPTVKETLFKLHREQFTGKVSLQKDVVTKVVYFRKGNPIYVDSSVRGETLGQMLLEQGRLTSEQYQLVIEKMSAVPCKQGEALVALGYMTSFEVYEALCQQLGQKIQNSFLLEEPEISCEAGEAHLVNVTELPCDFLRIFLDSGYAMSNLIEEQPFPENRALVIAEEGRCFLSSRSLHPAESKILRLLDGRRNFDQVIETSGADPDDAGAFLGILKNVGFLRTVPLPAPVAPATNQTKAKPSKAPEAPFSPPRTVVQVAPEAKKSPIYAWALRLDRPFHELLNLELRANRFQVRKNFDQIVRDLSLDAITDHYVETDRKIAETVLDRLTYAMTYLSDEKRFHKYVTDAQTRKTVAAHPTPQIVAEVALQKAKLFASKKKYDLAEQEIRKAIEADPKESSYHVELAELWIHKAVAEKGDFPAQIDQELKEALKLNPSDARAYYQAGLLYKVKGETEKAAGLFQKVLELSPKHAQASAELHLYQRRMEEKKKSGSSLLGMFKKKT